LAVGALWLKGMSLSGEISDLKAQAEALQPLKDEIAAKHQSLTELQPRLETLTTARHDTERWSRVLDHMSLAMPQDTWLINVVATQGSDEKPVDVTWTGMSSEQNLVGDLMLRMQQSPDFANVVLKYTDTKVTTYGMGIEWQITTEVSGTDSKITALTKEATKS